MTCLYFNDDILIPADKIVEVYLDKEHREKVVIWLVGGFIQTMTTADEAKAKEVYNTIKETIREL